MEVYNSVVESGREPWPWTPWLTPPPLHQAGLIWGAL